MPLFKMQGKPVTNFKLYRLLFDPYEAVRQRELLASFVQGHMQLNDAMRYHVAMVSTAVGGKLLRGSTGWSQKAEDVTDFPACGSYWEDELGAAPRTLDVDEDMCATTGTLVEEMRAWFCENMDGEPLAPRLCLLLTAAYALAQTDLASHPLDGERLVQAWERRRIEAVPSDAAQRQEATGTQAKECVLPTDTEEPIPTVVLAPDPAPYQLRTFEGKMDAAHQRIRTYRIEADTRSAFGAEAKVLLTVGERQVSIRRGDHIYINAIDGGAVCVLPDAVEQAGISLELDGGSEDHLSLSFGETLRTIRFAPGQKVTSFAVGETPDNILFIRDNRLCIDYYAQRANFLSLQILQERRVVQVRMIGDHYVVLQDNGRVHSSSSRFGGLRNVTTLEEIESKWKQYKEKEA